MRGRGGESGRKDSWHLRLEVGDTEIANAVTSVQKDYLLLETYPIKKQRNEYGKKIRKDYEAHRLPEVRRKDIKEFVPMGDGIAPTLRAGKHDTAVCVEYEEMASE